MYLFNLKSLVKDLKEKRISDGQVFKYYIMLCVIGIVGYSYLYLFLPRTEPHNVWSVLDLFCISTTIIIEPIIVFIINGGAAGELFFQRYITLSFFIGLRYLFYYFFIWMSVVIVYILLSKEFSQLIFDKCSFFVGLLLNITMLFKMASCAREIRGN